MNILFLLVVKDLRLWLNDRTALALTFIVPMALILVFGMVLGGTGNSGSSGVRLLVVDEAQTPASNHLIAALEGEPAFRVIRHHSTESGPIDLDEAAARHLLETQASAYRFALILPGDFAADGLGFRVRFLYNPQNAMESAMVNGLFQRAFFSTLPQLFIGRLETVLEEFQGREGWQIFREQIALFSEEVFTVDPQETLEGFDEWIERFKSGESLLSVEPGQESDALSSLLQVDDEQIFGRGRNLATQSIAGFAAMFLLFGLSASASSLFDDRNQQILHRLLAGPVSRMQILFGKYLFNMLAGCVQLAFLFAFGHFVFDVIQSPAQIPLMGLMIVALSAAATGFGMIICAYTRTAAQANGVATLLILTMSALGGAMIPSFLFPAFLRDTITPLMLVHWGVDGFLAILWRDATFLGILPYLGVLGLFTAITLAIATPRFLRDSTFVR